MQVGCYPESASDPPKVILILPLRRGLCHETDFGVDGNLCRWVSGFLICGGACSAIFVFSLSGRRGNVFVVGEHLLSNNIVLSLSN